jgi:spore cortex formation protein SpoVR/YcgB (stage V sporulation)
MAKKEVQRAFVYSYEESARTLLNNYLDNVEAYCNKTKLRDPITTIMYEFASYSLPGRFSHWTHGKATMSRCCGTRWPSSSTLPESLLQTKDAL